MQGAAVLKPKAGAGFRRIQRRLGSSTAGRRAAGAGLRIHQLLIFTVSLVAVVKGTAQIGANLLMEILHSPSSKIKSEP